VDIKGPPRVSRYGVNLRDLEQIGVAALRRAVAESDYVVVDEIGKMELFSDEFRQTVTEAIRSDKAVVGTVMKSGNRWVDELKNLSGVTVLEVTPENREQMVPQVMELLQSSS
jgi:nucleoside-triphosphatase